MNVTLRHTLGILAGVVFLANLTFAVCPGSKHQTTLAGYALSPDATRIAAIAHDGSLFSWDVATGNQTQLEECIHPEMMDHPILFSPDSTRLAVEAGDAVHIFDISSGEMVARLTTPKQKNIFKMSFSGDGRRLAASYEGGAIVWEVGRQAELVRVPAHSICKAVSLNRIGTLLALGCWDGLTLRTVNNRGHVHRLANVNVESVLFANHDQWIVGLTATPLPRQPEQRFERYTREIIVWDSANGKKLKSVNTDGKLGELRFGLASGGPHLLLATDFGDRLCAWDLDSGELKAIWKTSSGHPSADGKLLLREGVAPGQLELWEIGGADEKTRSFRYQSPLCADNFADEKGNVKLDPLFFADGFSDENQPFGSSNSQGYVAQDCTCVNVTRLAYKTEERARQELDRLTAQALKVLENGPLKSLRLQLFPGERKVLRLPQRGPVDSFAVIRLEGPSLIEIYSSSLPVALAVEKQFVDKR